MKSGDSVGAGVGGHLGILTSRAHSPATSPLAHTPSIYPPPIFFYIPWRLALLWVPDTLEGWPWESHYAYNQSVPPTTLRTTTVATLNPTASQPPLVHLHTEDRPNKVINQWPIFKWFAGRLKPLHTLPRVNSPTCCGARYPFSSADTGTASTGHLDINTYPASLHCRGTNYLNISIYICLYLICLRQTNCLGYKAGLSWHPKVTAHTEKGRSFEYST